VLKSIFLGSVKVNEGNQNTVSTLSNVRLDGIDFQSANDIIIAQLSWGKADLLMHRPKHSEEQVNKTGPG
jgi:hypothetical protein